MNDSHEKSADRGRLHVRWGRSLRKDAEAAVLELHQAMETPAPDLVIFFCSTEYDRAELAKALAGRFRCPTVGCTTAGEISPAGYQEGGIVAAAVASPELKVHVRLLSPLSRWKASDFMTLARDLKKNLAPGTSFNKSRTFGLLLIDGLSKLEDEVIASLFSNLEGIPVIGGSAGDDLRFQETFVYAAGGFRKDAAVFVLFETSLPFFTFKTQHFEPTDRKIVVTAADATNRIIHELNGHPAALEYARVLDLRVEDLSPTVFSENPVMIRIGGDYYVRSIQKANPDLSLSMFCAIEEGIVLTIGRGSDIAENMRTVARSLQKDSSGDHLAIFCDCILRKLEIMDKSLKGEFGTILSGLTAVGFSTYGEQFNSIHVNQTLTGVVLHG
jgi:hypothetical protein